MNRRTLLSAMITGMSRIVAADESKGRMTRCTVELPNHWLEYAVPDEVARQMAPFEINTYFEPLRPFKDGFRVMARTMCDLGGSFFTGPSGTLSFTVIVLERSADFEGDISTAGGLQNYIYWWVPLVRKRAAGKFGVVMVNGTEAVSRGTGSWDEVLSFPLDQKMFVEFGLTIDQLRGGSSASWIKRATAMRDAIRASITLRPKN
jgi:hypothetical protein